MSNINSKEITVIVQGAVDKTTLKTLKSVRKFLPYSEIILSTWKNANIDEVIGLYDTVFMNNDPGGYHHDYSVTEYKTSANNANRQLISTQKGLQKISRKYTLKLRSDIILTGDNFLNYWDKFQVQNLNYKIFNHRVICGSIYSRENSSKPGNGFPTPFHPSDFWLFGLSEDIADYFVDCPMQTVEEASNWKFRYPNRCPYNTQLWRYSPEQWFCYNWVKKHYPDVQFYDWSDWNKENIELSNNIIYNNFIILDCEESGISCIKHSDNEKRLWDIEGLINHYQFLIQYKNYCDGAYKISKYKKYKYKLNMHLNKLLTPFINTKKWISEFFSVASYTIKTIKSKNRD